MRSVREMAEEAGLDVAPSGIFHPDTGDERPLDPYLERFAALVRAEVLEEAALKCEDMDDRYDPYTADGYASAIRALVKEK